MRWTGHVARMGEERRVYRVFLGKPEGRRPLGDLGIDGWIILGLNFGRWEVGIWTGLGWPRIETGGGNGGNAGNFLTSCKPVSFSRMTLHHGVSK